MKSWMFAAALWLAAPLAHAATTAVTVYYDPGCGCCTGWVDHMREAGFQVKSVSTPDMAAIKQRLGVPPQLASCHTGVLDDTGQVVEGHVPAAAVHKLLAAPEVAGVSAPGMPLNAPGMGALDGNLITVDFAGRPFSRD